MNFFNCFLVTAECPGKADIVFAIPGSSAVAGEEFFPFEDFLVKLVDYFDIDGQNVNIGLIIYGQQPVAVSWLQPYKNQLQTNTRITLMSERELYSDKLNHKLDVAKAISLMRHMFNTPYGFPMARPRSGVARLGIVFTNGQTPANERNAVINAAKIAKADDITIYALGRGRTGPEFPEIGSDTCKLFSMASFIDGLPSVLPYLGSSLCTEMDRGHNVSSGNCFPRFWPPDSQEQVSCPSMTSIFMDPNNCAYYYSCDLGVPARERCPANMLFDTYAMSCNYKEAVSCYSLISCPSPRGLFPHPADCSKFLNCFDNIPYVQKCPNALWYNRMNGQCEAPFKVNCPMM
ncbi:hypothetical protein ScPMuIL_005719 [Solemya velum]